MMPPPPRLGGGEHSPTSAHVAVSGLTRSVGATSTDAGNARHGASRAPRGGGSLMTSFTANLYRAKVMVCVTMLYRGQLQYSVTKSSDNHITYTIRLPGVLHHLVMNEADDIRPDRRLENRREMNAFGSDNFVLLIIN